MRRTKLNKAWFIFTAWHDFIQSPNYMNIVFFSEQCCLSWVFLSSFYSKNKNKKTNQTNKKQKRLGGRDKERLRAKIFRKEYKFTCKGCKGSKIVEGLAAWTNRYIHQILKGKNTHTHTHTHTHTYTHTQLPKLPCLL